LGREPKLEVLRPELEPGGEPSLCGIERRSHSIQAVYAGAANYLSSASAILTQTVQ